MNSNNQTILDANPTLAQHNLFLTMKHQRTPNASPDVKGVELTTERINQGRVDHGDKHSQALFSPRPTTLPFQTPKKEVRGGKISSEKPKSPLLYTTTPHSPSLRLRQ